MSKKRSTRRAVLGTIGATSVFGLGAATNLAGAGGDPAPEGGDDDLAPPVGGTQAGIERTIEWDGRRGGVYDQRNCPDGVGYWQWILTPGGSERFEAVEDLTLVFEDGRKRSVSGEQRGRGSYLFDVYKQRGGTVESASVDVTGGGERAHLTIGDNECVGADVYWQVDFGYGDEPPTPPRYYPLDFVAAVGDSLSGVADNPSAGRAEVDGQLGDLTITSENAQDEWGFEFDDPGEPEEVTVAFELDEEGDERDLHLAVFTLPGPFDGTVDEQSPFDVESERFDGGDEGELTVRIPGD